jgi:hypothetical protein
LSSITPQFERRENIHQEPKVPSPDRTREDSKGAADKKTSLFGGKKKDVFNPFGKKTNNNKTSFENSGFTEPKGGPMS